MMRRAKIVVTGVVQGVFYRYNTRSKADELGVRGTVRNLADGGVEIVCEGEEGAIQSLIDWAKQGPRGALVEQVDVEWEEPTKRFKSFSILH